MKQHEKTENLPVDVQARNKKIVMAIIIASIVVVLAVSLTLGIVFWPRKRTVNFYVTDVDGWAVYQTLDVRKDKTIENGMPSDPPKENYTFSGWYLDKDFTEIYGYGKVSENLDLYARFVFTNLLKVPNVNLVLTYQSSSAQTPSFPTNSQYTVKYYSDADCTVEIQSAKDTGVYYAKLTLNSAAYRWDNGTDEGTTEAKILTWEIVKENRNNTLSMYGWKVGQTPKSPSVSTVEEDASVTYYYSLNYITEQYLDSLDLRPGSSDLLEFITTAPTAAGKYYVFAVIAQSRNYNLLRTNIVEYRIARADSVDAPTPEQLTLTYDGTPQIPALDQTYYTIREQEQSKRTNAGEYKIVLALKSESNYEWWDGTSDAKEFTWTITKAERENTVTLLDWTYGAANHPSVGLVSDNAEVTYYYALSTLGVIGAYSQEKPVNAGTYHVKAVIAAGQNYHERTTDSVQFTIFAATLTITPDLGQSKVFGASDPATLTFEASGWKYEDASGQAAILSGALTRAAGETAGTYDINIGTLTANGNYELQLTFAHFTVNKADRTNTVALTGWTYLATPNTPTLIGTLYETASTTFYYDTSSEGLFTSTNAPVDAGTYYVRAYIAETTNYNAFITAEQVFVIAKAKLAKPVVQSADFIFDGTSKKPIIPENDHYTISGDTATNIANTYTAIAAINDKRNYEWTDGTTTDVELIWKILKANRTNTVTLADWMYGAANHPSVGLIPDSAEVAYSYADSINGVYSQDKPVNAGTYYVKATISAGQNYNALTTSPLSFKILPTVLTITPIAGQSKVFGESDPVTLTFEASGWKYDDANNQAAIITGALSREAGEAVGAYLIKIGNLSGGNNYTLQLISGEYFEISLSGKVAKIGNPADKVYNASVQTPSIPVHSGYTVKYYLEDTCQTEIFGATDVGTYYAKLTLNDGYTWTDGDASGLTLNWSITKAVLSVTANAASKRYGQDDPTVFTYTINGWRSEADKSLLSGALSRTAGEHNVGTYEILQGSLAVSGGNYTISYVGASFAITKATLQVRADAKSKIYGSSVESLTYSVTGWEYDDEDNQAAILIGSLTRTLGESVRAYSISMGTLEVSGGNYEIDYIGANFTITPATLTITPTTGQGKVYGQDNPVYLFSSSGWITEFGDSADLFSGALSREPGRDIGLYQIRLGDLSVSGGNYTLILNASAVYFEITKATLTITANASSKTYGNSDPVFTYSVSGWQYTDGASLLTGTLSRSEPENNSAKTYNIVQGSLDVTGGNYEIHYVGAVFTVNRAALTVKAIAASKTYGADDPVFAYEIIGWKYDDEGRAATIVTGALSRDDLGNKNAGTYAITQGLLDDRSGNYLITFESANFVIQKAVLTITPDSGKTKVYGQNDPLFTFDASGWQYGEENNPTAVLDGVLVRVEGENVGAAYLIKIGTLNDLSGNYTLTLSASAVYFSITQATLQILADNQTKTYGEADKTLTFNASGWQWDDQNNIAAILTGGLTRTGDENVGVYLVEQGSLLAGGNYAISFTQAAFTILQATLTVTADAGQTKIYGQDDPITYTFTTSGWQLGDDESLLVGALSREIGVDVGTYDILLNGMNAGGNYTVSYVGASFSITPAELIITSASGFLRGRGLDITHTKEYGEDDSLLSFSVVSGWQLSDDESLFTGSLKRESGEDVGLYVISIGTLSAGKNYEITYSESYFSITPAELNVTATAGQTKIYGNADPVYAYTADGWKFNDVNKGLLSGVLERNGTQNVGTYTILQGTLNETSGNYTLLFTEASFVITEAALTVTAYGGLSKVYGDAEPAIAFHVTGWKGSDNAVLLTGAPSRENGVDVGSYPLNLGNLNAGGNYVFSLTPASFTITKAALTVTAHPITKAYLQTEPTLSYTASGWKLDDEANAGLLTGALLREAGEDAGIYAIGIGNLNAGGNYDILFHGASFTITKLDRTNTVEMNGWSYDGTPNSPSILGTVAEGAGYAFYYDTSAAGLFTSTSRPVDAGTYYVLARIEETTNYKAYKTSAVSFVIAKVNVNTPSAPSALTYTGAAQLPSIATNEYYTVSAAAQVNADTYSAVLSLVSPTNSQWSDGTTANKTLSWVIQKAQLAIPEISNTEFRYDGFQKSPTILPNSNYVVGNNKEINTGTYYATVTILDTRNYAWTDGEIAPLSLAWSILRAQLVMPTVTSADFVYNGMPKTPAIETNVNYTVTGNQATDVGTHTAVITINDTHNYEWKDAEDGKETAPLHLPWRINRAKLSKPSVTSLNIIYDKTVKYPTVATNQNYTISGEISGTDAGEYTITVSITNPNNYEWDDQSREDLTLTWRIWRAQLVIPTVTSSDYIYDGTAKSPSIETNANYTITQNVQTNAGTHTAIVIIQDNTNYEWTNGEITNVSLIWNILKADRTNTVTLASWQHGTTASIPSVGTVPDGMNPVYTYYSDEECENLLPEKPSDAGTYYVRAYLAEGANYRALTTKEQRFIITMGDAIARPSTPADLIYDGTVQLPLIDTHSEYTITYYSNLDCTNEIFDALLVGTYYAKVSLNKTQNYKWDDGTNEDLVLTWIIKKAPLQKPSASGSTTLTYTGEAHTLAITGFDPDTMEISGNTATETDDYSAVISLKNPSNYEWAQGGVLDVSIPWKIQKAVRTNTVSLDDWFVNATPHSPDVGTVLEDASVTYYYDTTPTGQFISSVRPSDVGVYYVRAYIAASANYQALTTDPVTFSIIRPSYTITFDSNGGTDVLQITEPYRYQVTQPSNPSMTGYTFVGWYTDNGTFASPVNWTYELTGNITFYAKWRINVLSITYDYADGIGSPNSVAVNYGAPVTLPTPVKKGFTFNGWTGGGIALETGTLNSQAIVSALSSADRNVTLVAQWSVNTLTIVYDKNGGGGTMTDSGPIAYNAIGGINVKNSTFLAPDEYLTFWRWNTEHDGTGDVVALTLSMSELWDIAQVTDAYNNKILTIYAEWDTIFLMSGSAANGQIDGVKTTAAVPSHLVIPKTVASKVDGTTYTVLTIGANAFLDKTGIATAVILADITDIGFGAFQGCGNISVITVPFIGQNTTTNQFFGYIFGAGNHSIQNNFVPTSLKTVHIIEGDIPNNAFYGCQTIEQIHMPNDIASIGAYAFFGCAALKTIAIPQTVDTLGEYAFSSSGLTSVNLANTEITVLDKGTFENCKGLVSIFFHIDTTTIGAYAFSGCDTLNDILILDAVEEIGAYAFQNCIGLTALNIKNTAVECLAEGTFYGAAALSAITLPDGLLQIDGNAFSGTVSLTGITLPNSVQTFGAELFSDGALTSISLPFTDANYGAMFRGLGTNLTVSFVEIAANTQLSFNAFANFNGAAITRLPKLMSITLPANLTSIGAGAFSGCNGLTTVAVPSTVTIINTQAFQSCTELHTVIFEGVSTLDSLGDGVFIGCSALTSVTIPDSAKTFGNNLFENSGVQVVTMPVRNTSSYRLIFDGFADGRSLTLTLSPTGETALPNNAFLNFNGTGGKPKLIKITLPKHLTSIGNSAFQNCIGLASISVLETVDTLGEYCFAGSGLLSIDLTETGVTAIPNGAFKGCFALSGHSIVLKDSTDSIGDSAFEGCIAIEGRFDLVNSVLSIGALAFADCTAMTELYLSTSLVSIVGNALNGSNKLTKVRLPLLDMTILGITYSQLFEEIGGTSANFEVILTNGASTALINGAFEDFTGLNGKPKLTRITLPDDLTVIGVRAFAGCVALGAITIPNSTQTLKASAFEGCTALQIMDLSNTQILEIADKAFKNCLLLNVITLREDITAIGESAFELCISLGKFILSENETTELPSTVYEIGTRAFYGCAALESINLSTTGVLVIAESAFEGCSILSEVHLPHGLTQINDYAFKDCLALLTLVIPNNEMTFGENIFSGSSLQKITMPLTYITYQTMFYGLTGDLEVEFTYHALNSAVLRENAFLKFDGTSSLPTLKKVTLPSSSEQNTVTAIEASVFNGCIGLTSATLSDSVTSIGNLAFAGCSLLGGITLPTALETLGKRVFSGCTTLTTVLVPATVTELGDSLFENSGVHTVTMPLRSVNYQLIFDGFAANAELTLTLSQTNVLSVPVGAFRDFNGVGGLPKLINITTPVNITAIGDNAFYGCIGLTEVSLSLGLQTVGSGAFQGCVSLQNIAIPASVSTIGSSAFKNCIKLSKIDVTALASLTTISESTFQNCVLLDTVLLPTSICYVKDSAFYGCTVLNEITIPSNVEEIGAFAFYNCSSLSSIDLSNLGTALSVVSTSAFELCTALSTVTLPTRTVEIQSRAFAGTTSLTSITVPNTATTFGTGIFSGGALTEITMPLLSMTYQNMFSGISNNTLTVIFCFVADKSISEGAFADFNGTSTLPSLVSVSLPTELESIGARAFLNCAALPDISVPHAVTEIGDEAFKACTELTTVTFSGVSQLAELGNRVFSGCSLLQSITLPNSAETFGNNLFENSGIHTVEMPARNASSYTAIFSGFAIGRTLTLKLSLTGETVLPDSAFLAFDGTSIKPKLIGISLPDDLTVIGYRAFEGCIGIQRIVIPNSVGTLGISAFEDCTGLLEIDLSDTQIEIIQDSTFKECTVLATALLSEDLTRIENHAFYHCAALSKIDISSNIDFIGKFSFYGCENIKKIDLSVLGTTGLSIISESAFEGCILLSQVTLPANTVEIQDKAFAGCIALTNIIIPNNEILFGENIFNASGLQQIEMPFTNANYASIFNGLKTNLTVKFLTQDDYTVLYSVNGSFANFNGSEMRPTLVDVTLPDNLQEIGANSFNGCSYLCVSGIQIPATVASIGDYAFASCSALSEIIFNGNLLTLGAYVFSGCGALSTILLPDSVTAIGEGVFQNSGVTNVTMPQRNAFRYQSIFDGNRNTLSLTLRATNETALVENAFANFHGLGNTPKLVSISLPNDLTTIGNKAFQNCSGITTVSLNGNLITGIGAYAFSGCTELTSIDLSNTLIETVQEGTFMGCTKLNTVVFWDEIQTVEDSAFDGCISLTALTLPNSVTTVGGKAFANATGLTKINFGMGLTSLFDTALSGSIHITSVTMPLQDISYTNLFNSLGGTQKELSVVFTDNSSVTALREYAFQNFNGSMLNKPKLISVILPSNLTEIERYAFDGCSFLQSITVYEELAVIGNNAFANCSALLSIDLSETEVTVISDSTFMGCTSLSEVFLANDVYSIGSHAFDSCKNLSNITVPSNVDFIGMFAFYECEKLASIDLSKEGGITRLSIISESAFEGCIDLITVILPANVTEIEDRAFARCQSLQTLTVPNTLTTFGSEVFYASGLTTITLPFTNAVYSNVFIGMPNNTLTVNFVDVGNANLRNDAFKNFNGTVISNLPKLISITLPDFLVTVGKSAFENCVGLTVIETPNTVTQIDDSAFMGCTSLHTVTLSDTLDILGDNVFSDCTSAAFTTIIIPSSVTLMGSNLFSNSGITKVSMPLRNAAEYQSILNGFANGRTLALTLFYTGETQLKAGSFINFAGLNGKPMLTSAVINTSGITEIGANAFEGCIGLTEIAFPASLTTLGDGCFSRSGLTSVNLMNVKVIPKQAFANAVSLGQITFHPLTERIGESAFLGCASIHTSNDSVLTLPSAVQDIGASAFEDCANLTEIDLGEGLLTIGGKALRGSNNLVKVTMPLLSTVTSYADLFHGIGGTDKSFAVVFTIGTTTTLLDSAFSGFNGTLEKPKLTTVTLPSDLQSIGVRAFQNCSALNPIIIPGTVSSLGEESFQGCISLAEINLSATLVTVIPQRAFMGCTALSEVWLKTQTERIEARAFEHSGLEEIHNINNAALSVIGASAFYYSKLQSLNIGNTEVQAIAENTFANCMELTYIVLPDTLQTIGTEAFYNCKLLGFNPTSGSVNTIALNNKLPNVTSIGNSAFKNCESMVTITLTDTSVLELSTMAFMNCYNLESVYLPSALKIIGASCFENDNKLISINPPDSLDEIKELAFSGCSSLSSLVMASILSISPSALMNCDDLSSITMRYISNLDYHALFKRSGDAGELHLSFTNSNEHLVLDDDIFADFNGTNGLPKLVSITLPSNLERIGDRAFDNCSYLLEIDVPATVESIGFAAFRNCSSLGESGISLTSTSVTEIAAETFLGCVSLTDIYLHLATEKIGKHAFRGCIELTSINFTGMALLDDIGFGAFEESGLSSVNLAPTNVTVIAENAFKDAKLTQVWLHAATEEIGIRAFLGNENLSDINITDMTVLHTIDNYAFNGCTAMKGITLPNSMKNIGSFAFSDTSLGTETVTLNNGLLSIGDNAFANTALTQLYIPISLTTLGANVFSDTESLTSVTLPLGNFNYGLAFTGITQEINIVLLETAVQALPNSAFKDFNGLAASQKPKLIEITFPSNMTSIGASAFQNCIGITSIPITLLPNGVATIENYAFAGCTGILSVDLTGTDVTVVSQYAFEGCTSLSTVTLRSDTRTIGSYAFYRCSTLTFDFTGMTALETIGTGAFRNTALTSVNLTSTQVKSIADEAFMSSKLSGVTLRSDTNTIGERAFSGNTSLPLFTVPTSVTSIGDYAFSGCTNLGAVAWNTTIITKIGSGAFASTKVGASFSIPNSVTTLGDGVFAGCGSLSSLTMPLVGSIDYASVLSGLTADLTVTLTYVSDTALKDAAFIGLTRLIGIALPSLVSSIGDSAFSGSGLVSIDLSQTAITVLNANTFMDCDKLTAVYLPATGFTALHEYAFSGCTALEIMTIPSTVITIGEGAFADCTGYALSLDTLSVLETIGDNAFENTEISGITIPMSVTSIGENIFKGAENLTSVTMPHQAAFIYATILAGFTNDLALVFNGGSTSAPLPNNAFSGFNGTTRPKLVSISLPTALPAIPMNAFTNCNALTTIAIPNTVTSIDNAAFSGCSQLTTPTLPNGLLTIGSSAFSGCTSLTSTESSPLLITGSVTTIGNNAFDGCIGLEVLTLPTSVTSIGNNAFVNCTSLMTLNILRATSESITQGNANGISRSAIIFVYNSCLTEYREAWVDHDNIRPFDPVISFESNGGTGMGVLEKLYGESLQIAEKPIPTRVGFTFVDWYTDMGLTNVVNWNNGYDVTDTVTFYAKWNVNTFTVTFNENNGNPLSTVVRAYGSVITEPTEPLQTGYTFDGWYSDSSLTTEVSWNYTVQGDITFYAKWNANVYTVSLNWQDNGATSTVHYIYVQYANGYYSDSGAITSISSIAPPSRTGYTFQGYYATESGGKQYITSDGDFTVDFTATTFIGNVTMYARWIANQYTVTWMDGNNAEIYTELVSYGVIPFYNTDNYGTPQKDATPQYFYTFLGWDTAPTGVIAPTTYRATFSENLRSYTVTWIDGNGVILYAEAVGYNIVPSYSIGLYGTPQKAMDTQYTYIFSGNWTPTVTAVTGAASYTAVFTPVLRSYTVTFETNGGSDVDAITTTYGSTISEPTAPIKAGYTFAGWYSDIGLQTLVTWNHTLIKNITLYAKWTEI